MGSYGSAKAVTGISPLEAGGSQLQVVDLIKIDTRVIIEHSNYYPTGSWSLHYPVLELSHQIQHIILMARSLSDFLTSATVYAPRQA